MMTPDSSRYWPKTPIHRVARNPLRQAIRAGLSRIDKCEQAAAGAVAAVRVVENTRAKYLDAYRRPPAANWMPPVHRLLEQLVDEMVTRGVHYEDAQREFEKRFVTRVINECDGNLSKAADALGVHRNTLARKMSTLKIKARTLS